MLNKEHFEEFWSRIETALYNTLFKANASEAEPSANEVGANAEPGANASEAEPSANAVAVEPLQEYFATGGLLDKNAEDEFNLYLLCEMATIPTSNVSLNTIFQIMLLESVVKREDLPQYCKKFNGSSQIKVDLMFDTLIDNNFIEYFQEYFYTERITIIKVMLNGDVNNIQSRISTDYANFTSNGGTDKDSETIYINHVYADFFKMFEEFSDMFANRILYLIGRDNYDDPINDDPIINIIANASIFELSYKINAYLNNFLLQIVQQPLFDENFQYNIGLVVPFLTYTFIEETSFMREHLQSQIVPDINDSQTQSQSPFQSQSQSPYQPNTPTLTELYNPSQVYTPSPSSPISKRPRMNEGNRMIDAPRLSFQGGKNLCKTKKKRNNKKYKTKKHKNIKKNKHKYSRKYK